MILRGVLMDENQEISINGWVLLDKPIGISSANALNKLKRLIGKKNGKRIKMGHAGTLDPYATGLLVVGLGEATKLMEYAVSAHKEYTFSITWGEDRDTLDVEGKVIATSNKRPDLVEIKEVAKMFVGEIDQMPPQFSAISVGGKRAYELARQGKEVKLTTRKVTLFDLKIIDSNKLATSFAIKCSKGFYVRSLARDIAKNLGACGYVSALRRTIIGKFNVSDAISLDKVEEVVHNANHPGGLGFIKPIQAVLDDILVQQTIMVTIEQAAKLKLGQKVSLSSMSICGTAVAICDDTFIAICEIGDGCLKPKRVFNL